MIIIRSCLRTGRVLHHVPGHIRQVIASPIWVRLIKTIVHRSNFDTRASVVRPNTDHIHVLSRDGTLNLSRVSKMPLSIEKRIGWNVNSGTLGHHEILGNVDTLLILIR